MHSKTKGSVGELHVAAYLIENGWQVLFPFGENCRYDLVGEKNGKFIRVQVKYVTPKRGGLDINCSSSNNWSILPYQPNEIDYLAVFDPTSSTVYFIAATEITKYKFKLRLTSTKNSQHRGVHLAKNYLTIKT